MMLPGNFCKDQRGDRRKEEGEGPRVENREGNPKPTSLGYGRTQGRAEEKGSESLLEEAEEQMENTHS